MNYLVSDSESTGYHRASKGSALDPRNVLCAIGFRYVPSGWDHPHAIANFPIEWEEKPFGDKIQSFQTWVDEAEILVFFNAKHDLLWYKRYGINFSGKKIWDCQAAKFIMDGQETVLPSLDGAAEDAGEKPKLDVVKTEYWEKGKDTDEVPWDILEEYLAWDVSLTEKVFLWQLSELASNPKLEALIWKASEDLLSTLEMEWNGLKYDFDLSLKMAQELELEERELEAQLEKLVPNVDWESPQQVSAVLFGGSISYEDYESYTFVYKDGRTKPKVRKVLREREFSRLVEPLPRSGLKKEGQFATDEKTLRKLRAKGPAALIIKTLLLKRKLNKKIGTYFRGIPETAAANGWTDGCIHGRINHCVADTGRLSSSDPNQQNLEEDIRKCIQTRFPLKG